MTRLRLFAVLFPLALLFPLAAGAQDLRPMDPQGDGFAEATRKGAPALLWRAVVERDAADVSALDSKLKYLGMLLADGRALMAYDVPDRSLPGGAPASQRFQFRPVAADGRLGSAVAIDAVVAAALRDDGHRIDASDHAGATLLDRGNGTAVLLGAWRGRSAPLMTVTADGKMARSVRLDLPTAPLRLMPMRDGYLVHVSGRNRQSPTRLTRFDENGHMRWSLALTDFQGSRLAVAERADGTMLAVGSGRTTGRAFAPAASVLIDRNGRVMKRRLLATRGADPAITLPSLLYSLPDKGFLLFGYWMGPEARFAAWLGPDGLMVKFLPDVDIHYGQNLPVGDGGLLAADGNGALVRFDRDGKVLWRRARESTTMLDIRAVAGNRVLVTDGASLELYGWRQ